MTAGDLVSGSLTTAARGKSFQPIQNAPFNVTVWNGAVAFTGTWVVVRSQDNGATWTPLAKPDMSGAVAFTVPLTFTAFEPNQAYLWAVSTATADGGSLSAGTLNYQFT